MDDYDDIHLRQRRSEHDPVATRWMILSLIAIWAGAIWFVWWLHR
jgi:hypothetical protein